MPRTNLFFKVEIEHEKEDDPERLGADIARQIMKTYGVQSAEMTNYVTATEEA
jgi:hypothetical protein